ncbi:MAG: hypothetical protein M1150_03970 [Patescibacteria group bacterium]|nr:hypothetical protein [Patescibacteria group bacterium]
MRKISPSEIDCNSTIVELAAKIEGNISGLITPCNFIIGDRFVRLTIPHARGRIRKERRVFILDHRPKSLETAKTINFGAPTNEQRQAERRFREAFYQPARVLVEERLGDYHISLHPRENLLPVALLVIQNFSQRKMKIPRNNDYWSYLCGGRGESILISIRPLSLTEKVSSVA